MNTLFWWVIAASAFWAGVGYSEGDIWPMFLGGGICLLCLFIAWQAAHR